MQQVNLTPEQVQQALGAVMEVVSGQADAQRILALTSQLDTGKRLILAVLNGQLAIGKPAEQPVTGAQGEQGTNQNPSP